MPFYEFHCDKCGKFEVTRSILDSTLTECPTCNGEIRQVFSPPLVIWRGRFRWMKFNPELDMDKIEAREGRHDYGNAMSKIEAGLKERN